ncbi:MAG: hypothetical protein ABJA81_08375, partial [Nocardioidaceae bacterium]
HLAVDALGHDGEQVRQVTGDKLEVALLDRSRPQPRKFRRIVNSRLVTLFGRSTDTPDDADDAESEEQTSEPAESAPEASTDYTEDSGAVDANAPGDPNDEVGDLPDDPDAAPHG